MRLAVIGNLIAHSRLEREGPAVVKLGRKFAFKAEQDMPLDASVVGKIRRTVFDQTHPQVAKIHRAPIGHAGFSGMIGGLDLRPVGNTERDA